MFDVSRLHVDNCLRRGICSFLTISTNARGFRQVSGEDFRVEKSCAVNVWELARLTSGEIRG